MAKTTKSQEKIEESKLGTHHHYFEHPSFEPTYQFRFISDGNGEAIVYRVVGGDLGWQIREYFSQLPRDLQDCNMVRLHFGVEEKH